MNQTLMIVDSEAALFQENDQGEIQPIIKSLQDPSLFEGAKTISVQRYLEEKPWSSFAELQEDQVSFCKVYRDLLSAKTGYPLVESLFLFDGCGLADCDLKQVFPNLKRFESDQIVSVTGNLESLPEEVQEVYLCNCNFEALDLSVIRNLKTILIFNCRLGSLIINGLPNLTSLVLSRCYVEEECLLECHSCPLLDKIAISQSIVCDGNVKCTGKNYLSYVSIRHNYLPVRLKRQLEELAKHATVRQTVKENCSGLVCKEERLRELFCGKASDFPAYLLPEEVGSASGTLE